MITAIDKYSALVLIDFQYNIVQMDTVHPVYEVLAKAASLVQTFRDRKLPIVYVNVDAAGAAWTYARKDTGRVRPAGTPIGRQVNAIQDPTAIVPQVIPMPNDIYVTKKNWNAFCNTTLHEELQKRFVTNIVLAGIATSIGVEGTARAASELGYNITFAIDAMTDRSVAGHRHSRKEIFPRLGEVGNAEDIIRQLQYIAVNV